MKYAYRLGKAMMLPVACLPVAGLLMGIGYWMDPNGYGADCLAAEIMIQAGSAILNHMSILFATGVATGLADEQDGTAVLAGVAAWLLIQNILTPDSVTVMTGGRTDPTSFQDIDNQMIGIFCGVMGAYCSNRYRDVQLFLWIAGVFRAQTCHHCVSWICSGFFTDAFERMALFLRDICLYGKVPSWNRPCRGGNLHVFKPSDDSDRTSPRPEFRVLV